MEDSSMYPTQVTPMLHVNDVDATIAWYESLGSKTLAIHQEPGHPTDWGILRFGDANLMVTGGGSDAAVDKEITLYFYTDDIEALYRALREWPEIQMGLETAFHGMREFTLRDPNGFRLVFGQRVAEPPDSMREPGSS